MSASLPLSLFTTWLARGERGLSSEAILSAVTGEQVGRSGGFDHPWDPADLRRCIQLLDAFPLLSLVWKDAIRDKSPEWAALVERWDELAALFAEERAEGSGKAPRTYALMRTILDGVRR